jgi:hypothetical protein
MSRFILIDHSLKGVGGHHFEYALHVLTAARRAGFRTILAAHRRFRPGDGMLPECEVHPIFRFTTYGADTLFHSGRARDGGGFVRRGVDLLKGVSRRFSRAARVRSFCSGLRHLFGRVHVEAGDHVFVPTLSELDLLGLARFLSEGTTPLDLQWHLQFHYNIFDGREPDFIHQADRLQAMRAVFGQAWPELSRRRVRFYNTTPQLTAQYDRLGLAKFETLPYPVNPAFHLPRELKKKSGPLRVTIAGAIRAEKGAADLADVLRQGWNDLFLPGKAQLVVQSNKAWFRLPLPEDVAGACEPVVYVPHPLEPAAYVELLRQADVGLLLYDSDRYYSRCSGVLVELLSLGVPVIVTAGCWMADQITPSIHRHIRGAMGRLPTLAAKVSHIGEAILESRSGAAELVLTADWDSPPAPGVYPRFDVQFENAQGECVGARALVAGRPPDESQSLVMAHVPKESCRIRVTWKNAYHASPPPVKSVEARLLGAAGIAGGSYPLGAVGLIAADVAGVGDCLRDIVNHFSHYQDTAIRFASAWRGQHNAEQIVSRLTGRPTVAHSDASRAA